MQLLFRKYATKMQQNSYTQFFSKKPEISLRFATVLGLLIMKATIWERVSATIKPDPQTAKLDGVNISIIQPKPVCATIFLENATQPAITLYQDELVNRTEFDNIRVNKLKNARFSVGKTREDLKHCRLEVCGFSESKDEWGGCEYFRGNVTAPDEIYGNDYEVTSVTCSCNPDSLKDTCRFSSCLENFEHYRWKISECAVLYQETGCLSCYFLPITLQNNTNFNTSNSYQIHSAIVRPDCLLRRTYTGFLWWDNEPGGNNFTNVADYILPALHKDGENFYCVCPSENELSTTTSLSPTSPTTTSLSPTSSTTTSLSPTSPTTTSLSPTSSTTTTLSPTSSTTTTLSPTSSTMLSTIEESTGFAETTETTDIYNNKHTTILTISIVVPITGIVVIGLLLAYFIRKFRNPEPRRNSGIISIIDKWEGQNNYSENIQPRLSFVTDEIQKLAKHFIVSYQMQTNFNSPTFREMNQTVECLQNNSMFELISKRFSNVCNPDRIIPRNSFTIMDSENPLGSGEFGIVYKGLLHKRENDLPEIIAVKKIKVHGVYEFLVESFFRELNTYQTVGAGHKHIVGFLGACCHSDGLYLLTEYCDGGSLRQTLLSEYRAKYQQHDIYTAEIPELTKNIEGCYFVVDTIAEQEWLSKNKQSVKTAKLEDNDLYQLLLWCEQIASGMEFLSSKRIVHVDLATRNILLTNNKTLKICDLGLSRKCLGEASGANSLILGQFPFHSYAPELISNGANSQNQVTLYVDIWAYGCTLWELFTLGNSLYPSVTKEGPERILKIRELILQGYTHPKPNLAPDFVYDKLLECWNEMPRDRPSFKILQEFFKANGKICNSILEKT